MVDTHRHSGSSFASSAFSRPSSSTGGRLTPHRHGLSIEVPDAAPFVPSLAQRPGSSLSRTTWTTDGTGSFDSEPEAEEVGSEGWEELDPEDPMGRQRRSLLTGARVSDRLYHHASAHDSDADTTALTPTTPITLPPASSSTPPSPNSGDDHPMHTQTSSFPSSDDGLSLGMVGLGVDPELIERQQHRLQMRSLEGMRERAAQHGIMVESDGTGINEDGEGDELWKDSTANQEEVIDAGVGGSGVGGDEPTTAVPFPSYTSPTPAQPIDITNSPLDRELPPLPPSGTASPISPAPTRSPHPSITSTATSSNSSTLSLPTVPPVDLTLPNRSNGPWMSVASGPMARLAADGNAGGLTRSQSQRGPRAFFSNLLHRSPRSPNLGRSPTSSPSTSPAIGGPSRSPSAPAGFQSPAVAAAIRQGTHNRASSLPASPNPSIRSSGDATDDPSPSVSRSPIARQAAAFVQPRSRAGSLQQRTANNSPMIGSPGSPTPSSRAAPSRPQSSAGQNSSSIPRSASAPAVSSTPPAPPPTLKEMGLNFLSLTQPLSLSRNSQPLCGALLDDKYILIGTTGGLDFLPIPLPGSLPMRTHGKKRRETRKPISLIKRTRFKELAVLSERSNILLAIAGRNDHIRVYALDGIRAMIEKKMSELDMRDGYPVIPEASFLRRASLEGKGKARADPPHAPSTSTAAATAASPAPPFQYSAPSPPPDYSISAPSPTAILRRRNTPGVTAVATNSPTAQSFGLASLDPGSPLRATHRAAPPAGNIVRAVPTNPRPSGSWQGAAVPSSPRTLRGSKSREFVATRKTSSAVIVKRKTSRLDIAASGSASLASRRSSALSHEEDGERSPEIDQGDDGGDEAESGQRHLAPMGLGDRRASASSIGDWHTEPSNSPLVNRGSFSRPHSRDAPRRTSGSEASPSASPALVPFSKANEPGVPSPVIEEADSPRSLTRKSPGASSISSPSPRFVARSATVASRDATGRSPTLDLAEFFKNGPVDSEEASRKEPREEGSPRQRKAAKGASPILELADIIRTTGPGDDLITSAFAGYSMGASRSSPQLGRLSSGSSSTSALGGLRRAGLSQPTSPNLTDGASTSKAPMQPRSAVNSRLKSDQQSPVLEMAEFLRRTGPSDEPQSSGSQLEATSASLRTKGKEAFRPSTAPGDRRASSDDSLLRPSFEGLSRRSSLDARPQLPRRRSSLARLIARGPLARSTNDGAMEDDEEEGQRSQRHGGLTLAEVIRDGPPAGYQSPNGSGMVPSASSTSINGGSTSSPTSKQAKRWTMGGMGSMFLNRPSSSDGASPTPGSSRRISSERRRSAQFDDSPSRRGSAQFLDMPGPPSSAPSPTVASPIRSSSTPLPPHDFKNKSTSLQPAEVPSLPAASQVPPDAHPANSSSPLEYVKLARTKGARLLRAVETKKRTYLAVLCGDEGERIELFTGSRSISLSLNRTFVLPENPKTIEFQIQGDDLIDIYLVYPESIFALEPATVRVREVGVGRGERRARRERERRMRDIASTASADSGSGAPISDDLSSTLHPADPALQDQANLSPNPDLGSGAPASGIDMGSRTPSPRLDGRSSSRPGQADAGSLPASETMDNAPPPPPRDEAPPVPPRTKSSLPYSTFQQLPFVPPVPSSVLSSAWIIPPLYTDVVGTEPTEAAENPSITVTGERGHAALAPDQQHFPLLSPISLLGGAAQRANGPPGLFFVSKGKNLSGIVTGDGRSVIKRPLVWNPEKGTESETQVDMYRRIEMIIVGGTRTVVVGVGPTEVKAIAVGGAPGQAPFGTALSITDTNPLSRTTEREVNWLGNHSASNQLFFSSRTGSSFTIHALAATA